MLITKPEWLYHPGEKNSRTPVFSCHVSHDGRRLATGGQDATVRVWDFEVCKRFGQTPTRDGDGRAPPHADQIARPASIERDGLLATLASHNGSVLCVRWSPSGMSLASASDDRRIVIWERDHDGGTVITGHESDVVDLAWSPDGDMLASCGLHPHVYIWDVANGFEVLTKLTTHTGFVKGVAWDPVGKFLATSSDDKSTKIWRVADWTLEEEITEPFRMAAPSTFFQRLSWSPEGSCLATSNGESGLLPTAPLIYRDGWTAEDAALGHRGPIECTRFSPVLFESNAASPAAPTTATTSDAVAHGAAADTSPPRRAILAIGGQDNSVSIWDHTQAAPLVVVKNLFYQFVTDMAWAPDGMHLVVSSYDGSLALVQFAPGELGHPVPRGIIDQALARFGYRADPKSVVFYPDQLTREEQSRVSKAIVERQSRLHDLGLSSHVVAASTGTAAPPTTNGSTSTS
ncbi:hypothetical protein CXG81DRAFT_327, partial [Caulochytrium protostelioides]